MTTEHEDRRPVIPEWGLPDRLRKARETAEMTQEELANLLHVARRTIVNYEQGKALPNTWTMVGWARLTNVDEEWLIGDDAEAAARVRTGSLCQPAA